MSKIQIIFPDVDDVCYNLRGNLIPVPDLSQTQVKIGYYKTFENLGKIAAKITKLSAVFESELKVVHALSAEAEKRGLPLGEKVSTLYTLQEEHYT